MQSLRYFGVSVLAVLAAAACSASSAPQGEAVGGDNGGGSGIPGNGGSGNSVGVGGTAGTIPTGTGGTIPTAGTGGSSGGVCSPQSAMGRLVREPVDIIIVLDNSGSMVDEMGAAETNIQNNFWSILDQNSVDFRMILISRHRQEARTASEEASTSICLQQPLSGLAMCPSEAPVFSDRFYQFGMKVESTDSFDRILEWYNSPDEENDGLAENGWSEWLRLDAKKVFVEMTDDNEDMPATTFIDQLTALPGGHFGTPTDLNFTFHTIMGIKEKANPTEAYLPEEPIVSEMCTGNGADVENAGETYQELSRLTGGLRFPLCQFPGYDAVFQRIAQDVVVTSEIACEFPIPEPPAGTELDPNKIAVTYHPGNGSAAKQYLQAATCEMCEPDAFCIPAGGGIIQLCDETCTAVQVALRDDATARVQVDFTCESTIIPPR